MKKQLKKYYLILTIIACGGVLLLLASGLGAVYALQNNAGIALILTLLIGAFLGFTALATAIFSFAFLIWRLKKAAQANQQKQPTSTTKQSNSRK